jgi:ABC-type uncharacterized transport system permease subunit
MRLRDRIGLSTRRQEQLARGMQLFLFGLVFVGFERQSPPIIINAVVGLGVTFMPAILERDYDMPMNAGLTLWISAAAFLHAVGVIGIPGGDGSLYGQIPNYDHVTHALSASVVAGAGYAAVRAVDEHSEDLHLPPKFMFVFILIFVVAFGVVWEILEFTIGYIGNTTGYGTRGFSQYGIEDTLKDLIFNTIGGVLVGIWGTVYLTGFVETIQERLAAREA